MSEDSAMTAASNSVGVNQYLSEEFLNRESIEKINAKLVSYEPQDILQWALQTIPHLYQTTAFGLSGMAILDMLSKLTETPNDTSTSKTSPPLIFIDTLYHFPQTYELVETVRSRYPNTRYHVIKPANCSSQEDFVKRHGDELWKTNEELYDYLTKVEPAQRAYHNYHVGAVITGRRKSQGGQRAGIPIVELTEIDHSQTYSGAHNNGFASTHILRINPLANWSFTRVRDYIAKNNVPYNTLVDQGYLSIGDVHSTQPVNLSIMSTVKSDSDKSTNRENNSLDSSLDHLERAGRWSDRAKTECGLHNPYCRYAPQKAKAESQSAANSVIGSQ